MESVQKLYGGSIQYWPSRNNWKPQHRWHVSADKAAAFLELILPYLIIKTEQAELALQFQRLESKRIDNEEAATLAARIKQAKVDI